MTRKSAFYGLTLCLGDKHDVERAMCPGFGELIAITVSGHAVRGSHLITVGP